MKIHLAIGFFLATSTLGALASADSACVPPPEACPPVLDAGSCRDPGTSCGGDAGTCEWPSLDCGGTTATTMMDLRCLGPTPPPPANYCGSDGGCSIATDPGGAATRAALPSFLVIAGALLWLVDRKRNKRPRG